jgi:two-component system, LytTR family, sensor kinase
VNKASFSTWFRLQLLLSGVVLAVAAVRVAQMVQLMSQAGAPLDWSPLLATESAIWLGWVLWGSAVIPLVRKLVERPEKSGTTIPALLVLVVAPTLVVPLVASPVHWAVFSGNATWPAAFLHMVRHNAVTNLLLGATYVGVVQGYLSIQRARRLEVTTARLNTQLADAQLDTLRAQLDPHFLFNALNSIAVLARRGQVQDVERMVTRLAGLLRHSLESSRAQLVTLRVELVALKYYLEIEQVRFGDRLIADIDVPETLLERVVPSFLLQPLVENSIRHGFTDPERPLHLQVRAREAGGRIVLTIIDDGAGITNPGGPRDGLGLGASRARVAGLYGGGATFDLAPGDGGRGTRVTITLPEPA